VIKSFKHKGLEKLFRTGIASGVSTKHSKRIRLVLAMLDDAEDVADMNSPGLRLHKLVGDLKDLYSVSVSKNWRITFRFFDGDTYIVNYHDYH